MSKPLDSRRSKHHFFYCLVALNFSPHSGIDLKALSSLQGPDISFRASSNLRPAGFCASSIRSSLMSFRSRRVFDSNENPPCAACHHRFCLIPLEHEPHFVNVGFHLFCPAYCPLLAVNGENAFQYPYLFILNGSSESNETETCLAYVHCHAFEEAIVGAISRNIYDAVRKIVTLMRPSFFVLRSHCRPSLHNPLQGYRYNRGNCWVRQYRLPLPDILPAFSLLEEVLFSYRKGILAFITGSTP
jgi:hypothetical protein